MHSSIVFRSREQRGNQKKSTCGQNNDNKPIQNFKAISSERDSADLSWTKIFILKDSPFDDTRSCTLCNPQSTYIYRAPQCMSPRRNWDSPNPFAASECALPPGPKGGGAHPPAPKGVWEFQFRRWRKSLALCLLCGVTLLYLSRLNSDPGWWKNR